MMDTWQYMRTCGKGFWPGDPEYIHHHWRGSSGGRPCRSAPWWQLKRELANYEEDKAWRAAKACIPEEDKAWRAAKACIPDDGMEPWQRAITDFNKWLKVHKPDSPVFDPGWPENLYGRFQSVAKAIQSRKPSKRTREVRAIKSRLITHDEIANPFSVREAKRRNSLAFLSYVYLLDGALFWPEGKIPP